MPTSSNANLYEDLLTLSPEESFYKKYYALKDAPSEREAYLKANAAYAREHNLLIPEILSPLEIFSEQTYYSHLPIGRGSDVNVVRHFRYTPVFSYDTSFFEIFYALHGEINYSVAGKPHLLPEGGISFIPPKTKRTIEVFDDDGVLLCVHIRHDTFDDAFLNTLRYDNVLSDFFMGCLFSKRRMGIVSFDTGGDTEIRNLVLETYAEARLGDAYSWRLLNAMLLIFFAKLLRGYGSGESCHFEKPAGTNKNILPMLSFISDNYGDV